MVDELRFVVPGKPVPNLRARSRRYRDKDGQPRTMHYTPAKTADERLSIRQFASNAMGDQPPMQGPIDLKVCWYRAVPKGFSKRKTEAAIAGAVLPVTKPDFDNYVKMIDALKGIVWVDDAQVTDAHLFKRFSDRPRVVIHVKRIGVSDGASRAAG